MAVLADAVCVSGGGRSRKHQFATADEPHKSRPGQLARHLHYSAAALYIDPVYCAPTVYCNPPLLDVKVVMSCLAYHLTILLRKIIVELL